MSRSVKSGGFLSLVVELQVATNRSIDKRELRTHLCRCRVDVPVLTTTDPSSARVGVIPAGKNRMRE